MSTTPTLPADAAKEGNVWCDACQQSLASSRAAAHLISKKHADNTAKPKTSPAKAAGVPAADAPPRPATDVPPAAPGVADDAKAPKKPKSADAGAALPRDPADDSKHWCGICQVSLGPAQAAKHLATKSHQTNAAQHLAAAMKSVKIK